MSNDQQSQTAEEVLVVGFDGPTLTIRETRERTELSEVYIRRRIATNKWRAFKDTKGRNRIPVEDIEAWEKWRVERDLAKLERAAAAEAKVKAKADAEAKVAEADKVKEQLELGGTFTGSDGLEDFGIEM